MSRSTIDFGIDLGTTNSAIAVLQGTTTDIIKNNLGIDTTPSAVCIEGHGRVRTGISAKSASRNEKTSDDVYMEFKRLMGKDYKYQFKTAGVEMTPEELSAEVLKELRGNVQQSKGESINSAVITVPAAFEQKQSAATRAAGELAGLYQCPLVQEPVAAALAYGYQSDITREYWLIFDFGGGTFDAAIMKAEDGIISVVNHGGDNYLGGSDIDWAVIEKLIIPEITDMYNLPDFRRGNQRWKGALASIKRSVEMAKIQLSRSDAFCLEDCEIKDADGEKIEIDYELTRASLAAVAEPFIMSSVEICQRVLKEKNLAPSAIEKMILVGGPTLAPYFREIIDSELGITMDFSVDPLTVVARGAAVFAGTQRIEGKSAPKAAAGQFDLKLSYNPIGSEENPVVRGTVKLKEGESIEGFTIEFVNQQTHWRSGKVPVKPTGRFRVDLLAEKGVKNDFAIELLDATGTRQECVTDSISYTIGLAISEQPLTHNISVALANNDTDVFLKKGEPLPAKAARVYRSTHAVKKGADDHVLNVPVVEGEMEIADHNPLLGRLTVSGAQISRDVPAGSEVELTIHMDESRIIRAKAYIPILDEEYEALIEHDKAMSDPNRLQQEYEQERARFNALREKAYDADDADAEDLLDSVESTDRLDLLERRISDAEADPLAAGEAQKRLLEMRADLDKADSSLKWPALVAEAETALRDLKHLVDQHAPEYRERFEELSKEVNDLVEQERSMALVKKMEQVSDLHQAVLFDQPGFWVDVFEYLIESRAQMRDQSMAERLINQGQHCIQQGNVNSLRSVVAQLLDLLPKEAAEAIQRRAYGSSLQK